MTSTEAAGLAAASGKKPRKVSTGTRSPFSQRRRNSAHRASAGRLARDAGPVCWVRVAGSGSELPGASPSREVGGASTEGSGGRAEPLHGGVFIRSLILNGSSVLKRRVA